MATRLHEYIVYRHGSNAANQSMCNRAPVAVVNARNATEACKLARESGEFTVYVNQFLSAIPATRVSRENRQAAFEETQGGAQ